MAKPALLPEWAINIVNDPISFKDNRTVPSQGERDTGFVPLNVKPLRQHTNWLFNTIFKWLEFFDGVVDQDVRITASPTFNAITTTATVDVGTILTVGGASIFTGAITINSSATVNGTAALLGATTVKDLKLLKNDTNEEVDTVRDVRFYSGYYEVNSLAANSQKKLFDFPTALIISRPFAYDIRMTADAISTSNPQHTRLNYCASLLVSGNTLFLANTANKAILNSGTGVSNGDLLLFLQSNDADNAHDGTAGENFIPWILIKEGSVSVRNTHDSVALTNIKIFFELKAAI